MMKNIEEVRERMEEIYTLFPEGWEEKARELGALERARNIKTAKDLLMLNLAYQTNGKSLGGTSALLKSGGSINLDKNAVYFRIQKSMDWNNWLTQNICRTAGIIFEKPEFLKDRQVIAVDATDEKMNAKGSVLARLHYAVDIYSLKPMETIATSGKTGEKLTNFTKFAKGDIILADRAYGTINSIEHTKSCGAEFIIRLKYNAFTTYDGKGERFDITDAIKDMNEGSSTEFGLNYLHGGKLTPVRICVYRKTSEQAADSKRQIKKSNKKKRRTAPSDIQLFYGNYVIVATSLPFERDKILDLYKQRWQIELLFKRLKSLFDYDDMPARTETTMKAFISGKLLLAAICEALVMKGRFSPKDF
ncbi:MAG: transposase [Syntrophomonadaceae bacterium]|jgi:hypothetical protein|nr:transposase [Syntrophomonadaceae bacterium]